MTPAPIKITLDDYVLSGGGANGESYFHKTDPDVMLKLYFPGKVTQPMDEMMLALKVYALGIPTPEPGEYVVTEDGRYGIRFRRIPGKKSYARATADDPENVQRYAADFAEMCLALHKVHVDTTAFESVKDRIQIHVPGQELIIERNAKTFEDAITECADAMKEKLTRFKEKLYEA